MDYTSMNSQQLLAIYNEHASTKLKSWGGKKVDLIDRIKRLKPAKEVEAPAAKPRGRTVRAVSLELLCKVVGYEDRNTNKPVDGPNIPDARSVGLPYSEVIAGIKEEFPDAQTSVACLRWYAVKIRQAQEPGYESLRLPQRRPRAPIRREATAEPTAELS